MSRPSKYSGIVVNLLIAVAISLVVNFSYVLLLVVEKSDDRHPPFSRELRTDREIVRVEGDVWISPDGHGYLLYVSPERLSDGDAAATGLAEVAPARDSVYIPPQFGALPAVAVGRPSVGRRARIAPFGRTARAGTSAGTQRRAVRLRSDLRTSAGGGDLRVAALLFLRAGFPAAFAPAAGRPRAADVGIFSNAVCCVRGLPSGSISSPLSCVGGRTS